MKIIKDYKEATIEVKNSKFYSKCYYVDTEDVALDIIKNIKKKYFDARHNCYVYKIGYKTHIIKQSDDGEPKGTAGLPILNVIEKRDLTNCLIIVTRYFGGVLLGASLLLRTYQDSAIKCLEDIESSNVIEGKDIDVIIDYSYLSSIKKYVLLNDDDIYINNEKYENNVSLNIFISNNRFDDFKDKLDEITKGNNFININKNILWTKFKNEVKIINNYEKN